MTAQCKLKKDAAEAQAACTVEGKELKRKAAIKEKEQNMSEKEHDKSEPDSAKILEDSQHQHEPGDRTKRV